MPTDRRLLLGLTLLAALLPLAVALGPLEGIPHVSDELAYTLQARLLAGGSRTGPPPDDALLTAYPFWVTEPPRSFSPFPVGWPLLLALGERLRAGWLINPLLAAALPLLTWRLADAWAAPEARPHLPRLAALLAAISPGIWVLSASRMAHTSVLVALLLAAVVFTERRRMALGGLAIAYVLLARPFDGVFLGGPLLLWGLLRADAARTRALLLGLPLLGVAGTLADNAALTGDPLRFAMNAYLDVVARPGCNRLGFGPDVGCHATLGDLGHTPWKALQLAGASALRLDRLLLGLPGGLLLAGLGLLRLPPAPRRLALLWLALVVGSYALYWSPGQAYGARFWHPLYVVLPLLTAAGLCALPLPTPARRLAPLLPVAVVLAALPGLLGDLGDRLWCVDRRLQDALGGQGITDGVVFLRAEGQRAAAWPALGVDQLRCTPLLEAGDLLQTQDPLHPNAGLRVRFALDDLDATRSYMQQHHPGAAAWIILHNVQEDTREIVPLGVPAP